MKKKTVKLTKKAEVLLKHMEIHSIKDLVFAAQYDPLSAKGQAEAIRRDPPRVRRMYRRIL